MTASAEEIVLRVLRDAIGSGKYRLEQAGTEALLDARIDGLKLDSLDTLEVIMKIEDGLSCQLPEHEVAACVTVADLVSVCQAQMRPESGESGN